ncbi:hypothetical protein OGAPHI_003012 [Ogataea philodendri]|uniref:Uncharacterized protein n=1 Tax=Ogataea philodendri TaxID=1378263 RepID=A0A9P8P878_9ASCO|nr:uncharacterized protein OGAPHI_003012 [Ogataea philodendri]KAH3667363.1 hypothetical protein OGAPHI_003012 [Ogataea philodendri]
MLEQEWGPRPQAGEQTEAAKQRDRVLMLVLSLGPGLELLVNRRRLGSWLVVGWLLVRRLCWRHCLAVTWLWLNRLSIAWLRLQSWLRLDGRLAVALLKLSGNLTKSLLNLGKRRGLLVRRLLGRLNWWCWLAAGILAADKFEFVLKAVVGKRMAGTVVLAAQAEPVARKSEAGTAVPEVVPYFEAGPQLEADTAGVAGIDKQVEVLVSVQEQ